MKIALIHCPFEHRTFSENLKIVDEEFCLAPPIVLAYVAAILEKAGHEAIIIDANALKLSKEDTLKILINFAPDFIGFRVDTYWFHRVVEWANYFKEHKDFKIIIGGINATLYPKESLSYPCFDYGIAGEANESLPSLISALANNNGLDTIEGVIYREGNNIIVNKASSGLVDFNSYPFPSRHLLPNHLYSSFTSQRRNFTIMLTSTGCPYKCNFCAISPLIYRERSADSVVEEIEECFKRYNVREIDFFDATFFINKKRSYEICEKILENGIKVEWSCRSRVDLADRHILKMAARAGCKKIYYGIESASSEVLNDINKDINIGQIESGIELTRRCGINTLGFFMVGSPGDNRERILSSINFAKRLRLDFIQVCRAIPKPDTELNNFLIKSTGRDYWRDHILGDEIEGQLPKPWLNTPEEELEVLLRKFYREFYFRPSYIMRRIYKVKSIDELARYARVALKWIICNNQAKE